MGKLVIKGTTIVTMNDKKEVVPQGDVYIEDSLIKSVGPAKESYGSDVRVIEGGGKVALPGLINAHTHAAMTLFRGYADDLALKEWLETKIWPAEAHLTPEDVYWGTLLAIAEMIKGGTTCFADMYFYPGEVARAVKESGIRASLCGVLLGILPTVEQDLEKAVQFTKEWHGAEDRITTMFGPHALYTCQVEHLKKIAGYAKDLGVGIHIHLLETRDERKQIKEFSGREPFDALKESGLLDLPILAAHSVYLNADERRLIKDYPFTPVHTPGSNLKLASGIGPIWEYRKAGIVAGLGTDGAASNNNLDMFEEARLAALIHKVNKFDPTVISAYEALEMATYGGAKALGLEKEIGQIKEGMRADVILVNMKQPHLTPLHDAVANLVYSASAADVTETIVNGEVLMENRKLLSLDENEVMREAWRTAAELLERDKV